MPVKLIVDHLDLSKNDEKLDEIIDDITKEVFRICNEHKETYKNQQGQLIAHARYLILHASVILSQALERKVMILLDDVERDIFQDLIKENDFEKR